MSLSRVHLIVSGRVQGVCFRHYTREEATRLGVTGWVRNLPDGTVELVAEGTAKALESLVLWCHNGPPSARVADVDVKKETATGEFRSFRVTY